MLGLCHAIVTKDPLWNACCPDRRCLLSLALLFGATGMIGAGALLECLADPRVESVLSISRSPTGRTDPKLRGVIRRTSLPTTAFGEDFSACDACFFCLGVTSVGMSEAAYTPLAYDLTLAAAKAIAAANPSLTFCISREPAPTTRSGAGACGPG